MKYIIVSVLFSISNIILPAVSPAYGADYGEALKLVRKGEYVKALSDFEQLGESGHSGSQFSAGLIYHMGRGVNKDLTSAYEWYKKAALQHHPGGLNNIGMMYLNGEYVAQNRRIAFRLFEMASPSHSQAKDNLAKCFEEGWGTDQDTRKAVELYQTSGNEGYILGWYHLGQLYEKGYPDTPKDLDKAVEWYTKAANKNSKVAKEKLQSMGR